MNKIFWLVVGCVIPLLIIFLIVGLGNLNMLQGTGVGFLVGVANGIGKIEGRNDYD